jgi:peptidoglycan/xylan/chitin deacetylase (PgdA/CDA1 family)
MNLVQKFTALVTVGITTLTALNSPEVSQAQTSQNYGPQYGRNYGQGYYRSYNRYDTIYYYYRGRWYRRTPVATPAPTPKPPVTTPTPVPSPIPVTKPPVVITSPEPVPTQTPKPPTISAPPVVITPPVAQSSGVITLHFDDGYKDVITNAAPIMKQYGFTGDYAIIGLANTLYDTVGYASDNDILDAYKSGVLIPVAHSQNHFDLTTLTAASAEKEIADSQTNILRITGYKPDLLVTPYCASNSTIKTIASKYYKFVRNCGDNGNIKGQLDPLALDAFLIEKNTTLAEIQSRITDAKINNKWLIIGFHHVSDTGTDDQTVKIADFRKIMEMVKSSGLPVKNTNAAYNYFAN